MGRQAARIVSVSVLFAACVVAQALLYPANHVTALAISYIVPVALAALFWGMIPGLAAGMASTIAVSVVEAFVDPSMVATVVMLGALFYAGIGALLGRMADLTRVDRRRVTALEEARAHLASVLAAAKDAVVTIDELGRVTSWNAAAERMFGWGEAEMLGRALHDRIAGPAHHPGGGGLPVPAFPRPDETRYLHSTTELEGVRRDGTTFPAELSLASYLENGHRHAVGIVRDLSERHAIEERYRRLFDTVPVGLYRTTPEGVILAANPAMVDLLGFPDVATLLARGAAVLFADPDERGRLLAAAEREGVTHDEVRVRAFDGSVISCLLSIRADRGPDGSIVAFDGSLQDVTRMRELEVARRRAERLDAVGALAAGIAHDFSNILTGIRGFAEHLGRSADAGVAGAGRRVVEAVDRADRITADLLAVMGTRRLAPRRTTLPHLCRLALAPWESSTAVALEVDGAAPDVEVDVDTIISAIRDLVENALAASPPGSPVVVRIDSVATITEPVLGPASVRSGPWARMAVVDRGTGMDEVVREHLFEPYFTTKPFGTGAGLGLPRVLGILRQHDGGIAVDSLPGRGTTVTIYLPRAVT